MPIGKGRSKPFTVGDRTWPSRTAFCREFGLSDATVRWRLADGYTDMRLAAKSLRCRLPEGRRS